MQTDPKSSQEQPSSKLNSSPKDQNMAQPSINDLLKEDEQQIQQRDYELEEGEIDPGEVSVLKSKERQYFDPSAGKKPFEYRNYAQHGQKNFARSGTGGPGGPVGRHNNKLEIIKPEEMKKNQNDFQNQNRNFQKQQSYGPQQQQYGPQNPQIFNQPFKANESNSNPEPFTYQREQQQRPFNQNFQHLNEQHQQPNNSYTYSQAQQKFPQDNNRFQGPMGQPGQGPRQGPNQFQGYQYQPNAQQQNLLPQQQQQQQFQQQQNSIQQPNPFVYQGENRGIGGQQQQYQPTQQIGQQQFQNQQQYPPLNNSFQQNSSGFNYSQGVATNQQTNQGYHPQPARIQEQNMKNDQFVPYQAENRDPKNQYFGQLYPYNQQQQQQNPGFNYSQMVQNQQQQYPPQQQQFQQMRQEEQPKPQYQMHPQQGQQFTQNSYQQQQPSYSSQQQPNYYQQSSNNQQSYQQQPYNYDQKPQQQQQQGQQYQQNQQHSQNSQSQQSSQPSQQYQQQHQQQHQQYQQQNQPLQNHQQHQQHHPQQQNHQQRYDYQRQQEQQKPQDQSSVSQSRSPFGDQIPQQASAPHQQNRAISEEKSPFQRTQSNPSDPRRNKRQQSQEQQSSQEKNDIIQTRFDPETQKIEFIIPKRASHDSQFSTKTLSATLSNNSDLTKVSSINQTLQEDDSQPSIQAEKKPVPQRYPTNDPRRRRQDTGSTEVQISQGILNQERSLAPKVSFDSSQDSSQPLYSQKDYLKMRDARERKHRRRSRSRSSSYSSYSSHSSNSSRSKSREKYHQDRRRHDDRRGRNRQADRLKDHLETIKEENSRRRREAEPEKPPVKLTFSIDTEPVTFKKKEVKKDDDSIEDEGEKRAPSKPVLENRERYYKVLGQDRNFKTQERNILEKVNKYMIELAENEDDDAEGQPPKKDKATIDAEEQEEKVKQEKALETQIEADKQEIRKLLNKPEKQEEQDPSKSAKQDSDSEGKDDDEEYKYDSRYYKKNPTQVCNRCKKPGHFEKWCTEEFKMHCWMCLGPHKWDECNQIVCFQCYNVGHRARDCPALSTNIQCHRCNRKGHKSNVCGVILLKSRGLQREKANTEPYTQCLNCQKFGHANCTEQQFTKFRAGYLDDVYITNKANILRPEDERDKRRENEYQDQYQQQQQYYSGGGNQQNNHYYDRDQNRSGYNENQDPSYRRQQSDKYQIRPEANEILAQKLQRLQNGIILDKPSSSNQESMDQSFDQKESGRNTDQPVFEGSLADDDNDSDESFEDLSGFNSARKKLEDKSIISTSHISAQKELQVSSKQHQSKQMNRKSGQPKRRSRY